MDFAGLAETAVRLIEENGAAVTLVKNSAPGNDYDPVTGEAPTTPNQTLIPTRALKINVSAAYTTEVGKENVGVEDYLLLFAGEPLVGMEDAVRFVDGRLAQVVRVKTEQPNGLPLLQTVQVRP